MRASQNNCIWFVAILWTVCSLHPCWLTVGLLSVGTVADNNTGSKEKSWSDLTDLHSPILPRCSLILSLEHILTDTTTTCMLSGDMSVCCISFLTDFPENQINFNLFPHQCYVPSYKWSVEGSCYREGTDIYSKQDLHATRTPMSRDDEGKWAANFLNSLTSHLFNKPKSEFPTDHGGTFKWLIFVFVL